MSRRLGPPVSPDSCLAARVEPSPPVESFAPGVGSSFPVVSVVRRCACQIASVRLVPGFDSHSSVRAVARLDPNASVTTGVGGSAAMSPSASSRVDLGWPLSLRTSVRAVRPLRSRAVGVGSVEPGEDKEPLAPVRRSDVGSS
jgi:hypothetical protein